MSHSPLLSEQVPNPQICLPSEASDIAGGNTNSCHTDGAVASAPRQSQLTRKSSTHSSGRAPEDTSGGENYELVDLDPPHRCKGMPHMFRPNIVVYSWFLGTCVVDSISELKKIVDLLEKREAAQKISERETFVTSEVQKYSVLAAIVRPSSH